VGISGFKIQYGPDQERRIIDLVEDMAETAALGERRELVVKFNKPDLLIIDEFGMRNLPAGAA